MLLVGTHALAQERPDWEQPQAEREIWLEHGQAEQLGLADALVVDNGGGDSCARLERGGHAWRLVQLAADDARRAFLAANLDRPLLADAPGWPVRIASATSVALIWRAQLYLPAEWHTRIEHYHRLRRELDGAPATHAEHEAFEGLRASVLARADGEPGGWTMRVSNEAFFQDFKYPWLRVHGHDELHRATCYGAQPLYRELKDDQALAFVPRQGFERLPHADRIRLVREECYALALERVLIPAGDLGEPCDAGRAFRHSLRRICTTLARGWFRDFAIDHYPEIVAYDKDFVADYDRALRTGALRRKSLAISTHERRVWLQGYWANLVAKDRDAALPTAARG